MASGGGDVLVSGVWQRDGVGRRLRRDGVRMCGCGDEGGDCLTIFFPDSVCVRGLSVGGVLALMTVIILVIRC
jgi:hypothetical protein